MSGAIPNGSLPSGVSTPTLSSASTPKMSGTSTPKITDEANEASTWPQQKGVGHYDNVPVLPCLSDYGAFMPGLGLEHNVKKFYRDAQKRYLHLQ